MQSAFGPAPVELIIENDTGVNQTLNRLHGQYSDKADYLEVLGVRPQGDGMYYEKAAAGIAYLQLQGPPLAVPMSVEVETGELWAGIDTASITYVGEVKDVKYVGLDLAVGSDQTAIATLDSETGAVVSVEISS